MTVTAQSSSGVDIFSDEVLTDPYPVFAELREQASVVRLEKTGVWAITRYQPIREAMGNWSVFSSNAVAFNDRMNEILVGTSLATDPPDHQQLRAVISDNLSPRALRRLKGDIEAKADDMVADLVRRETFDAVDDLARALPLAVVVDLIGVQGAVRDNILSWGEAAFNLLGPMNERAIDGFPLAGELFEWAHNVQAKDLVEGSMGHAIFAAGERGEIPHENCGMMVHQLVAAGMDSTIAAISNAIAMFAAHPDQFDLVRDDPSLIPSAFNEVLRYEAPIHAFGRRVKEDYELDGTMIPAGSQIAVLFGSGNRDPRHYEDPDTFRVRRNPVDHLSFGYGPHSCAGQGLARLEASAVIGALARRVRRLTVGTPQRRLNNSTRSLDKLPVVELEAA
ncbi:cytochrome P450 [Haloactinomyces albus]|uniref:Cytochrome P450 n=1 Tax=Haloactinomyces albus TaxID=1352928 RepID=A0AAE3ZHG3_9ACTN|nr:cytochrome P450 [Haloactinomyces albus]MDR7303014.1 cytochrome P450 [Haloactinomyces albus]